MIYKNLNRVKGIISAKQGTEIPKYSGGAKFKLPYQGSTLYSIDKESWFTDEACSNPFTMTETDEFRSALSLILSIPQNLTLNMKIPGSVTSDPNVAVAEAAKLILKEEEAKQALKSQVATIPVDPLPTSLNDTDKAKMQANIKQSQERASAGFKLLQEKKSQQLLLVTEGMSGAINGLGDIFQTYNSANNSNATNTINTGVDMGANLISNLGDKIGGKAGAIMGAVGQVIGMADSTGQIIKSITGGTDLMTATDKFFDSGIGTVLGGFVNQIWAQKSDPFATDVAALEAVGSSYGGTAADIAEAAKNADKKYGLFSSNARRKANETAKKVAATQNIMSDVANTATDQRLAVQSMGEQAGLAYSMMTDGGYNQKYTYAAKHGGLLEWNPVVELEWEPQVELNWELPTFKDGGSVEFVEELEWIPELKDGGKTEEYPKEYLEFKASLPDNQRNTSEDDYRTYLYWQLWGKPKNFQYTLEHPDESGNYMYTWDNSDNSYHASTIAWKDGVGYFMKPKHHSTLNYELDWYNKGLVTEEGGKQREMTPKERKEWEEFKSNYELVDDGEFYKYIPKNKKGGSLGDSDIPETEETTQKNVIPEGALHKNKHHMEHAEGLTKKGIPVVDEDGEQQAEIEHSEIIFTLEVTKKLEEYYEIFYSEDSTNKEKEQAALDAGKLLVYQILENTEDRTGLIESCKKGGTLTFKKDTEELIEEVLEWMPTVVIVEEFKEEKPEKKEDKLKANKLLSDKDKMKEAIKEVLIELLIK